jgi:hypothetical protein
MLGFIVITYFVADVVHKTQIEQLTLEYNTEIETIEEKNIYFTTSFLESSVLLDSAREDRAFGNYHFDLAQLFFTSALSENNETKMYEYKDNCIDNCTKALPKYKLANENFKLSKTFYNNTKKFTNYEGYLTLLGLYVNLTSSGARLTLLRYNATKYLLMIAENITYSNGAFLDNVEELLNLFNETMESYAAEQSNYEEIQQQIDEYDIEGFTTIREPPA